MKFKYIAIIISLLLGSCSEEYFDKTPTDQLTEGNYYVTATDFENATNSVYSSLRNTYGNLYDISDVATDNCYCQKSSNNFDVININESNVTTNNAVISSMWKYSYTSIARANIVLSRIENTKIDDAVKTNLIGQARFLRALMYYNLVRIYGDVPLVLSEITNSTETYSYGRESVGNIYIQIVIFGQTDHPVPI